MQEIVAAVPPLLIEAYGDALLAVVLFGSVARGTPHNHSDSDWLVVLRQRSPHPRSDHCGAEQMRQRLAPLFLDLCHDGIPLYDPEGWAARFLADYRHRLQCQGSVRVPWGDGWYWRLTPEVKPASEVWF